MHPTVTPPIPVAVSCWLAGIIKMIPISRTGSSSIRSSTCDCLYGFVFIATLAFLVCVTPAVLRLLILLQPAIPDFHLNSSSLAILNVSSYSNILFVTADWNLILSIHNPNKNTFSYRHVEATSPPHNPNFTTLVPTFVQDGQFHQNIPVTFPNTVLQFANCSSPDYHNACSTDGNLTMQLQARVTYGGWTWPVKTDSIEVVCRQDLKVQSTTFIIFDFRNATCDVDGRWKILVRNWTSLFWNYLYFVVIFLGILFVSL